MTDISQEPAGTVPPSTESPITPVRNRTIPAILLSAILMTLAFPPVDWGWLAWAGLAPLFWAIPRARRPRAAFGLGYLFGITHWGVTILWIGATVSAWTHSPAGWVAWVLLTLIKSLWFGLFGFTIWWLARRTEKLGSGIWVRPLGIAAAWTIMEWLRGQSSVAMPWSLSAYTQYRFLAIIQAADIGGLYVITFVLAYFGAAIAEILANLRRQATSPSSPTSPDSPSSQSSRLSFYSIRPLAPPLLLAAMLAAYGTVALNRAYAGSPIRLALMQPNIASKRGDAYTLGRDLERYRRMASRIPASAVDLVVWPESTVGEYLAEEPSQDAFQELARSSGAYHLLGTGAAGSHDEVYNSAILVSPSGGAAERYDKNWLVPMGEWILMRPILDHFDSIFHFPPDTTPGVQDRVMSAGSARLCVLICYETLFPIVSRTRCRAGANLLVAITNDSWAGESPELQQHIAMAAFRAVENRRWLASSATTGITGLIDPVGRIDAIAPYREDVMIRTATLRKEITFYARFGDWVVALCAAGLAALFLLSGGGVGSRAAER